MAAAVQSETAASDYIIIIIMYSSGGGRADVCRFGKVSFNPTRN